MFIFRKSNLIIRRIFIFGRAASYETRAQYREASYNGAKQKRAGNHAARENATHSVRDPFALQNIRGEFSSNVFFLNISRTNLRLSMQFLL